jgi:putative photosynthetic complex assembly protein 2
MSSIFSIFFVLFLWWFLTGIILYTAKRLDLGDSKTRFTVVLVTLPLFFCAWYFYFHCLDGMSYAEIFCSFMASLFIWGWVELTFLTGVVAGIPLLEKQEIDRGSERERFINGFRSIALNECLLISCLFLMAILSIGKLNNFGLTTFLILYVARVSAKLNLFFGVPYINLHFLTAPLKHIATFCRVAPIGFFFIASTIMLGLMFLFLVGFVIYSESMSELQFGYLLLSTLAGLAILEHLFMALPIKDATLWNWLLPNFRKSSEAITVVETKPNFPKESKNEL